MDAGLKESNLRQLRRIEGQVRGIIRMVEDDRYCADIIPQVSAARQSLQSVAQRLLRNHLGHCAARAVREGGSRAEGMVDEVIELMGKMSR